MINLINRFPPSAYIYMDNCLSRPLNGIYINYNKTLNGFISFIFYGVFF